MKDAELKQQILINESRIFRNLIIMIDSDPEHTGLKTLEDFKRHIQYEKRKLDKWISENVEDE